MLAEEYEEEVEEKINQEIARKIIERQSEVKLGNDTYSMAFRAFHNKSSIALDLSPREIFEAIQAVFFVISAQLALIVVIFLTMADEETFEISMPASVSVFVARFVCSIMMHLQVATDEA